MFSGMKLEPICKLWLLRFMNLSRGNCDFIEVYGFDDERLARQLGFSSCLQQDEFCPGQARKELRELLKEAEGTANRIRPPKAVERNLHELNKHIPLTDSEQDILAFALMAHTDVNLQSIFDGSLKVHMGNVAAVVAAVVGLDHRAVSNALHRNATLYKSGLLQNSSWDADGSIREFLTPLSDKFASCLVFDGVDMSTLFDSAFREVPTSALSLDDFEHLARDLEPVVRHARVALETKRKGVNYLLFGAPGTGKTELSRVLGEELKVQNFEIVVADEDDHPISAKERACAYRSAQSYLCTSNSLITFDEVDDLLNAARGLHGLFKLMSSRPSTSKAWLNRVLESNEVPTIWIANSVAGVDPAVLRRFDRIIEVPVPPQKQRERIVERLIPTADRELVSVLASSTDLVPAVIQNGVDFATIATSDTSSNSWRNTFLDTVNSTLRSQAHSTVKVKDPARLPPTYDIAFINANADLKTIARQLRCNRNARICLNGPSGTGKSAFVRWLATELGMSLKRLNASDLLGPFVGQTEEQIRAAFATAERTGDLLLIDEVDSFLLSRDGANRSWEVTQVNEFLAQMECFGGLFAATTNFQQSLDNAAFRRFDLKIEFSYSNKRQSEELLREYCKHMELAKPTKQDLIRMHELSNLTPGDFATAERRSQFSPLANTGDFVDALIAECNTKIGCSAKVGFN